MNRFYVLMFLLIMKVMIILVFVSCGGDSSTTPGGDDNGDGIDYTVSGNILDASGKGISGVSVKISGKDADKTYATGTDGAYSFTSIKNGTYTITPTKNNYTFSPASRQISVSGLNMDVDAFTGTPGGGGVASVSGIVLDKSGNGIAGIKVILKGKNSEGEDVSVEAVTDSQGNYIFTNVEQGRYITECYDEKLETSFSISGIVVEVGSSDVAVDNFMEANRKVMYCSAGL